MKRAVLLGALLFFIGVPQVHAASLYMDPASSTLSRGDTVKVAVRLDTAQDECINAVDAVIHYPSNIELVDASRGDSIMSVWLQSPTIDTTKRTISFAGGIPNGYCGRIAGDPMLTNTIIDLIFQSPGLVVSGANATTAAAVTFDPSTEVLLNDGKGTKAPLTTSGAVFDLKKGPGTSLRNDWDAVVNSDQTPPEPFAIDLERTPQAYDNHYFITFNTTDKQSGIDHYEVMEEPLKDQNLFQWGRANAPWIVAQSPYELTDQSLNSTIRVKAVDKAGNDYIATLVPDKSQRTLSQRMLINYVVLASLALLALFILAVGIYFAVRFTRRRRARNSEQSLTATETEVEDDYESTEYEDEEDV
jgi:hypothetical protein